MSAASDWRRDQRCLITIGLCVPSFCEEPMRSLHFLPGRGLVLHGKISILLLELWNVFMLPHFLNRECVGVLFTFWKSLFENEISRDYLKGIVSFPYADIFH